MTPLLRITDLSVSYGALAACRNIDFSLGAGQVIGIVGESGSGKTTLLQALAGRVPLASGSITYCRRDGSWLDLSLLDEGLRRLVSSEWGYLQQNPRDGLRMAVSAGGNIAEPLLDAGLRSYGQARDAALHWLRDVEIDPARVDDLPATFSGGMQQRLQLARILVAQPRVVLMDEPTGGLDLSVQARFLDLVRSLVRTLGLSAIVVTHDLGVARLLAHRLFVMQGGRIVESGLTDQVLDDPHHAHTQMLVSATLTP